MSEFKMRLTTYLILSYISLILLVVFMIEPNAGQKQSPQPVPQATALESSLLTSGSSKINSLSSSKFRERISKVQRTFQQPIQQQQITSSFVSNEQRAFQQRQPTQLVQFTEQQQSLNDLSSVQQQDDSQSTYSSSNSESIYGSVQGTPGVDFPNYSAIPNTKFSCDGVPFEPGMYADESTGCQVYHLCYDGRRESFLCGIGTVFNQAILNCDFWHSVDCSQSSLHYGANADFGKSLPEPGGNNFQIFAQKSVTQLEQSSLPVRNVQQRVVVEDFRRSSIVQPATQNFAAKGQNFESRQQFSGGKISPPRQQASTNLVNLVTSPGRRAVLLNKGVSSGAQQITSAESSMIKSLSMQIGGIKSGKTNSPTPGLKSAVDQNQIITDRRVKFAMTTNSGLKSPSSGSVMESSFKVVKNQNVDQNEKSVWKPYSRNKGKTSSNLDAAPGSSPSVPPAPVNQITDLSTVAPSGSTSQDGDTSTSPTPDSPLPTVAQPDQEPTFSAEDNSQPSAASEVPKIPNSNTPPSTEAPVANDSATETSSTSASIESDVSPDLTTTTSAPASESTESSATTTTTQPSDSDSATNETPDPANTTTSSANSETSSSDDADSSKPSTTTDVISETTKSSAETSDVTTTTPALASPDAEAPAQVEMTTTAKPDSEPENTANEAEIESKKKRGASVVEYASRRNVRKSENSSSVVYAPKKVPSPEHKRKLDNLPNGQPNATSPKIPTPVARDV